MHQVSQVRKHTSPTYSEVVHASHCSPTFRRFKWQLLFANVRRLYGHVSVLNYCEYKRSTKRKYGGKM